MQINNNQKIFDMNKMVQKFQKLGSVIVLEIFFSFISEKNRKIVRAVTEI